MARVAAIALYAVVAGACPAPAPAPAGPPAPPPTIVEAPPDPEPPDPPPGEPPGEQPPGDAPDAVTQAPDGADCLADADCASGACEGEGCGAVPGRCVPAQRVCTKDLRPYCGCDGQTFRTSGTCPGRRYAHRGECRAQLPDGSACTLASDCASGICEGKGCGVDQGVCVPKQRRCTRDLRSYCGCDGVTFRGSGSCPGRRYQHEGACATAAPVGSACTTGADCDSGVCEGQGCGPGQGACADKRRMCTADIVPYCGCDGTTFRSSSSCPGNRFAHRGACS